jgi:MYXO-CTERM domain-containing protein
MSKNCKTLTIWTVALGTATILGIASPAPAAASSLAAGQVAPGRYEPDDTWIFDHTVQEDGVDFGGDISLPPIWGGETDDLRSFFIPPEKIKTRWDRDVVGSGRVADPFDQPLMPDPIVDVLGLLWEDGASAPTLDGNGLGGASIGADPFGGNGLLMDFEFDPSPSYDVSFDDALSAGLMFTDELAALAAPTVETNPLDVGTPLSSVPAPGALGLLGVAALLGRRRRR